MKAITILLLIPWFAAAQESAAPDIAKPDMFYGITLGGNVSNVYNNGASGSDSPGLGFRVGLSATYEAARYFLQGSVAYLTEKHRADFGTPIAGNGPLVVDIKYSWVEIPITFNFKLIHKKQTSIFIGSGVSIRRSMGVDGSSGQPYNFQVINNINEWNIFPMLQIGAALKILNKKQIGATICYQTNAMKLYNSGSSTIGAAAPASDTHLNSINVTMWYSLSF